MHWQWQQLEQCYQEPLLISGHDIIFPWLAGAPSGGRTDACLCVAVAQGNETAKKLQIEPDLQNKEGGIQSRGNITCGRRVQGCSDIPSLSWYQWDRPRDSSRFTDQRRSTNFRIVYPWFLFWFSLENRIYFSRHNITAPLIFHISHFARW